MQKHTGSKVFSYYPFVATFFWMGQEVQNNWEKNKRRKGDRVRSYHQITFRLHFLWRNQVAVQNNRVQKSISTFFVGNDGKSMISLHTFYMFISVFKFYKHRRHISLWINIFITFLCTYSYWHLSATRT